MYSATRYRTDLAHAWKPVKKVVAVFWKSLLKLDPFKTFGPCLLMVVRIIWFLTQGAFFIGRRLTNI